MTTTREALSAEVAVLGAVLLSPDAADEAFEILRADHFASEAHRLIWRACEQLRQERKPLDPVVLEHLLAARGDLDRVGGVEYLHVTLQDVVPHAKHALHHAKIVRDRALERRILEAADDVKGAVQAGTLAGEELAAAVEARMLTATADDLPEIPRLVRDRVWVVTERLDQPQRDGGSGLLGLPTGLDALDEMTAGWRPGQYVVLAARPSQGKTSLGLHTALTVAAAGKRVLFLSLEMGIDELIVRALAHASGLDSRRLELNRLRDDEYPAVSRAVTAVGALPLWIDDTPTRTVASVRAVARRWRRKEAIDLVLVDYLQLVSSDGKSRDRVEAVTEISKGLKQLAREIDVPVIALCQLSRGPEARPDARPRLSDLRESGAIEQDADVVVFLWNDPEFKSRIHPPTTLIIAKQRNGPTGDVRVTYHKPTGRWSEWVTEFGDSAAERSA